jgi:hypothetical protein
VDWRAHWPVVGGFGWFGAISGSLAISALDVQESLGLGPGVGFDDVCGLERYRGFRVRGHHCRDGSARLGAPDHLHLERLGLKGFPAGVRQAMRAAGVGVRVLDPVETAIDRWLARSKGSEDEPETVDDPITRWSACVCAGTTLATNAAPTRTAAD